MLTPQQIQNASNIITTLDKNLWITLFRQNMTYQSYLMFYSDNVASKIDLANNTDSAKMLNALMELVAKLGSGVVEIRGDDDAVWWSQKKELNAIVTEAFYVLYGYDASIPLPNDCNPCGPYGKDGAGPIGVIPDLGIYGSWAAIGQRPQYDYLFGGYASEDPKRIRTRLK